MVPAMAFQLSPTLRNPRIAAFNDIPEPSSVTRMRSMACMGVYSTPIETFSAS